MSLICCVLKLKSFVHESQIYPLFLRALTREWKERALKRKTTDRECLMKRGKPITHR